MDSKKVAAEIFEKVGGKSNVTFATFCMTRLRITFKDKSKIKDDEIKSIPVIVGTQFVGGQYQVIIGPAEVANVTNAFCELAGIAKSEKLDEVVDEDLVKPKEKITAKTVLNKIMDGISGSITPMLPIITVAGLLKMIVALLGPSMLNVLSESNDFMRILTVVGNAGFYFFPVFAGYGAAKKFKTNIPIALLLAVVMISPDFINIVEAGKPFAIYGIPMTLVSYSSSFIPIVLTVWVMSYIDKWLQKVIPGSLKALLYPLLLTLIMLPLELCVLGPIGTWLGKLISDAIVGLHGVIGPVTIAIVGALWPLLIATGMHQALIAVALTTIAANGFDDSILVGAIVSNYPMIAVALVYLIKSKDPDTRAAGLSGLLTLALGGISEPTIFGILLRYKKTLAYILAGGFAGGLFAGIMKVAVYFVPSGNLLVCLGFAGERASSLPMGVVSCVIAFVVAFVLAMIFGVTDKQKSRA